MEIGLNERQRIEAFLNELSRCLQSLDLSISFATRVQEEHVVVEVCGEDREIFVQKKAEALDALQYLLRKSMEGAWKAGDVSLIVDACGYRELRERELGEMARIGCQQVVTMGKEFMLGPLNPYERRIVHLWCQSAGGVATRSLGEGYLKKMLISPAGAKGRP